jgi:Dolichyl-phosphate-mannose-protein mannosyltransferase
MLSGRADATFPALRHEGSLRLEAANRALTRVPVAVWLAGVVALSALFRFWVARSSPTPWIMPDEYIYAELSRSFAETGHFAVNGADMAIWSYGPLYPLLIAPAWLLTGSAASAYAAIQLVNSVLMSLAAVPAYYLGRRVLTKQLSFFLAVLTVLVPSMVYSSKAMTESLAYPVFLTAVLAITVALERPTRKTQGLALLCIAIACLTRAEMVMLVPAFLSAIVLLEGLGGEGTFRHRMARHRLVLGLFALTLLAGVAWSLFQGGKALGAHAHWMHVFDLGALPRWILTYVAELDLYVGIVPFAAFLVILSIAWKGPLVSRGERTVVAVIASTFLWLLLLVAAYSTQPRSNPILNDRYLFYVVPLVLLAFLLWIKLGAPRPRPLVFAAAAAALALPLLIPFADFLTGQEWGVSSSSVALVPWGLLKPALGAHTYLLLTILAVASVGAAAFLYVPLQRLSLLRFLVVLNFLFITLFVLAANMVVSDKARERWLAPTPNWIDNAVGSDARVVGIWALPSDRDAAKVWNRWNALMQTQFANHTFVRLYALDDAYDVVADTRPFVGDAFSAPGGRILEGRTPIDADYVVVGPEVQLDGTPVAQDPNSRLGLYRVDGTLRVP